MDRSLLLSLASTGLFVGTLVFSFFGCYDDVKPGPGACQPSGMPLDDCMIAKCNADGTSAPVPVPNTENRACVRGANQGVCVDGTCALLCATGMTMCKCDSDASCPTSTLCKMWACEAGECKSTLAPDDTVVDTLEMSDCKKLVCQAGMVQTVEDATDVPDSVGCTVYTCDKGMVKAGNASPGAACSAGFCNTVGACVSCLTKADWDACGATKCQAKLCNGESCTANNDCKSSSCADGVCCNSACTSECQSCAVPGKGGTCSNIPYLDVDNAYTDGFDNQNVMCSNLRLCDGMGKCLVRIGKLCNVDQDCLSNKCVMPPMSMSKLCLGAKGELCSNNGQCASNLCNTMTTGACN